MSTRKRIGLMVPSTNTRARPLSDAVPRGITVHGQRLWLTNEGTGDDVVQPDECRDRGGRPLSGHREDDVIVYGCTTGSFFKGPGWDREMCGAIQRRRACPRWPPAPRSSRRSARSAARRISVATPYPEWNNQKLRAYLEAHGFDVLNVDGEPRAAASGNQGINDQDPESVVEFASRACRPDADALLCSCTRGDPSRRWPRSRGAPASRWSRPTSRRSGLAARARRHPANHRLRPPVGRLAAAPTAA